MILCNVFTSRHQRWNELECDTWYHQSITHIANSVSWAEIWEFSKSQRDVILTKIIFIDIIRWFNYYSSAKFKLPMTVVLADFIQQTNVDPDLCRHMASQWVNINTCIETWATLLNSLWNSDAIWRHRYRLTLGQVMPCCLTAPSHYLNQCWLLISKVPWHSPESNHTAVAQETIL